MGLDQYLTKKLYVKQWDYTSPEKLYTVSVQRGDGYTSVKSERITYIDEEVGYWRKANQIHQWFVENVQGGNDDCGNYYVEYEQLKELLSICLRIKEDPSLAPELLPSTPGFFFGSTDYNEWYMRQIDYTITMLEPLLVELDTAVENREFPDIYYSSSW
jgi:hypothetical protein